MKYFPFDLENFYEIKKKFPTQNFDWPVKDQEIETLFNEILTLFLKKIYLLSEKEKVIIFSDFQFFYFIFQHIYSSKINKKINKKYNLKHFVKGDSYKYFFPKQSSKLFKYDLTKKNENIKNLIKNIVYNNLKNKKLNLFFLGSRSKISNHYIDANNIGVKYISVNKFTKTKFRFPDTINEFTDQFFSELNILLKKKHSFSIEFDTLKRKYLIRLITINNIVNNILTDKDNYLKIDGVIFSQIMNPLYRAIAGSFKLLDKSSISFDHGTSVHYYDEIIDTIFLLNSTTHVCFNKISKQNLSTRIKDSKFSFHLKKIKLIYNKEVIHNSFFKNHNNQIIDLAKKEKIILLMGFPMGSLIYPGLHGYSYFNKVNLELDLIKYLKTIGCKVLYKVHPERAHPVDKIMEKYCDKIIYERFENLKKIKFDAILHTYYLGSTFTYSLCGNYNIIVLDQDLKKCTKEFKKILKDRCHVIKGGSINGIVNFEKHKLKKIITNLNVNNDINLKGIKNYLK